MTLKVIYSKIFKGLIIKWSFHNTFFLHTMRIKNFYKSNHLISVVMQKYGSQRSSISFSPNASWSVLLNPAPVNIAECAYVRSQILRHNDDMV